MEPIDRIQYIQRERWDLVCVVCKQRMGAKIQCSSCYQAYHPLCGRLAGLQMEMQDPAGSTGSLRLMSYCPRHCKPRPELGGKFVLITISGACSPLYFLEGKDK